MKQPQFFGKCLTNELSFACFKWLHFTKSNVFGVKLQMNASFQANETQSGFRVVST